MIEIVTFSKRISLHAPLNSENRKPGTLCVVIVILGIKTGRKYPVYGSTGPIGFTECYEFDQPTVLVARVGANAGKINRADGKYGVTDNTLTIQLNNYANLDFVVSLLEKINLNRFVFGSGQPLITGTMLKRIKLTFPNIEEQKKIAKFLTAVDTKIEQLGKKKALLEQYKKGIMQKLFSQELRFKDEHGDDFPGWKRANLGDLGTFKNGINKDKSNFGFGNPFINLNDVFGKHSINSDIKLGLVNVTKNEVANYDLRKGDVIYSILC